MLRPSSRHDFHIHPDALLPSVLPRLQSRDTEVTYVSQDDILTSLKNLTLGIISPFFRWNISEERFEFRTVEGKRRLFMIDGKDDVVSER